MKAGMSDLADSQPSHHHCNTANTSNKTLALTYSSFVCTVQLHNQLIMFAIFVFYIIVLLYVLFQQPIINTTNTTLIMTTIITNNNNNRQKRNPFLLFISIHKPTQFSFNLPIFLELLLTRLMPKYNKYHTDIFLTVLMKCLSDILSIHTS